MKRQSRKPMCFLPVLVIASAANSSAAITPMPSQDGRYQELNGISASFNPSFANGSRIAVAM